MSPGHGESHRWLPFVFALGVAVAVVLLVLLAAGGSGDTTVPAEVSRPGPAPDGGPAAAATLSADRAPVLAAGQRIVRPVAQREPAPQLRVQTTDFGDGSVFDLAEERGNVVILYFTAAWCPTCIAETKALARIADAHADHDVRIIALDVDQTESDRDLADYRERTGAGNHLWAFDRDFLIAQAYEVRSLGSTVFIDREGRIAYRDASQTSYETLDAIIEALR
jgi:peroxiredoxin